MENSRIIKFRAWDKEKMKWFVITTLDWYKADTGKTGLCGVIVTTETNHDQFRPIEEVEIVEFTGLLDKNGKEIYEFDQLKGDWDVVNDIYLGTVEFYGGAFRIKETGLPLAWADKDKDCEVVGNKFEGLQNPSKGDIM